MIVDTILLRQTSQLAGKRYVNWSHELKKVMRHNVVTSQRFENIFSLYQTNIVNGDNLINNF